ncbi:hypothetical protein DPMN_009984 [Dreissena polymorpha]|uniref:Uncharacterized protein n=1 Tax=Dreissena polymorpha TaxID=45954 RepID=A0A9D4N1B2_DREPO|nr:hypothetical protein DPMN_009984 [Dreissena polymorpha]
MKSEFLKSSNRTATNNANTNVMYLYVSTVVRFCKHIFRRCSKTITTYGQLITIPLGGPSKSRSQRSQWESTSGSRDYGITVLTSRR